MIKDYKDLEVWQLAVKLITKVYKLLNTFPREEKFGTVAQCKDSVLSIAANIAESWGRFHFKDRCNFLYHARGSLIETENHLIISYKLKFINKSNINLYKEILSDIKNLTIKLNNYINSTKRVNSK